MSASTETPADFNLDRPRLRVTNQARSAGRLTKGSMGLPPPFPDVRVGIDRLPEIEHIVVLMMENHSFDNYFGMLGRGNGFTLGQDGQPTATNPHTGFSPVPAHAFSGTGQWGHVPTQSWNASHIQFHDGANDGFVDSVDRAVPTSLQPADPEGIPMGYWTEKELPFYYDLAREFALVDKWFCDCPGPTNPNRRFLISATAYGLIDDDPFSMFSYPPSGTVFDLLTAHRITWRNYHSSKRIWTLISRLFPRVLAGARLARSAGRAATASSWKDLEQTIHFTGDVYPLAALHVLHSLRHLKQFRKDAAAGRLPAFSIVDPEFDKTSEENPQNIADGQRFAWSVIKAVMDGPNWRQTLLIWLYDEHGGYYDHVPPPEASPPDNRQPRTLLDSPLIRLPLLRRYAQHVALADAGPRTFDRYGFRVPAVVVSPYAKQGWVSPGDPDTAFFDHTSILRLVEEKWNLPALTHRDLDARNPERGSILDALDFTQQPRKPSLREPA